jgi:hypothetical protein
MIDPGHGGLDPGVVANARRECDTNLLAARALLAELLRYEGVVAHLTHKGSPVGLQSAQRAAMANSAGADLLVSLHADAAPHPSVRGHHVIYSMHGDVRLAQSASDSLAATTGRVAFRAPWTMAYPSNPNLDYYAIIRDAHMPAIIIERGFLTNPEDAALLFDAVDLSRQAAGIAAGIAGYFGLRRVKKMSRFKDVPDGHWAYGAIVQGVEQGWLGGYPDGTFKPSEKIARAEVASAISRAVMYIFNTVPAVIELCKPAVVVVEGTTQAGKTSMGTGTLITTNGYILTNEHVVYDHSNNRSPFTNLRVGVLDNPNGYETTIEYPAQVVATSNWDDLALIKIEGTGFPALPLADKTPAEGSTVVALGHPNWSLYSSTVGIVSQDRAVLGALFPRMQTDAAINPGNSGGPMVDLAGRIVAVSQAKYSDMDNMGFGVLIEDVRAFVGKHLPELVK